MQIDMLFNYANNDPDVLMQSQGVEQLISDGTNIPKEDRGYHKKGDVIVLWNACTEIHEEASIITVSILKSLVNKHAQDSWRLDILL